MFAAAATIAIGCSFSTAAAEPVEARVYALGSDYFTDGIFDFKCKVVPTDGSSASFYAACTREQVNDLGGGEVVTLDIGPRPAADMTPKAAATAARLQMVPPRREIIRIIRANTTTAGPARRRRQTVPEGPRSILIILVNYVDMEVTYATEASARLMMQNPDARSVDGLYQAVSYGRLSWPEALTTVITVNSSHRGADLEGCDAYDMAAEADLLVAEQHPDVNTDDFVHTAYLIPHQIEGCGWDGSAAKCPSSTNCKVWVRSGYGSLLAHELGHNLGLGHAASDPDDDGVLEYVYGDGGSIMGWAGRWVSVNAPHRERLGYIGEGNGAETYDMDCAAQSVHSQRSMTISRLDLAPGPGNPNPNMVRIARHPRSDYLLSFKALADWDGVTADVNLQNRLQIHTHDGSGKETLLVKALADGESFTGAASRDGTSVQLSITVTDTSADTITVTIDTGCPTYAPTSAPFDQLSFRGNVVCGETVTGTTELPGVNITGNAAADHYWHFSLPQSTAVIFDGCASEYDTWIRVMNRNLTIEVAESDDGGGCSSTTRTRLAVTLGAGEYAVVMEGYADNSGTYTMRVVCPSPPPPPTVCVDADEHCGIWRDYGYCVSATHDRYMHTNCLASCGMCPGNALPTPPLNVGVEVDIYIRRPIVTSTATANIAVCHHALCGAMSTNQPARSRCPNEHGHCAEHFEHHEVRCCSDTLKPGWRKHTDQCPWAESDNWNADVRSCQHSKTFDEAEAFCMSVDARLCTRAEIQTNCVRATGCGHDLNLIWSSHADAIDHAVVAANIGYATTSDEPETNTMAISADQQMELAADNSATPTDDDNNSNGAAIAVAILGSLGVVTTLATILYVRQQRQKSTQLEDQDGNARPLDLSTAGSSANPPALSLRTAASEAEVFQLSPNGQSIRLESVQRGNPMYRPSRNSTNTDHEPAADLGPLARFPRRESSQGK